MPLKTPKKGQLELMGLAVIVLIVSLGMIFAIRASIYQPLNMQTWYNDNKMITDFINTLFETNVPECSDLKVKELLINCYEDSPMKCQNNKNSCEEANSVTEKILKETLNAWRINYTLYCKSSQDCDEEDECFISKSMCSPDMNRETMQFSLPISPPVGSNLGHSIQFSMAICKKAR